MNNEPTESKKVLIIDDERSVLTYLDTLLKDNGYQTVTAVNGREGLEKAKAERPDLVTLDITMPEKSGVKFYRELKDDPELGATPVIIVTAVTGYGGDPDVFEKFISTRKQVPPPEAFVSKPIVPDDFVKTVAEVLSQAS